MNSKTLVLGILVGFLPAGARAEIFRCEDLFRAPDALQVKTEDYRTQILTDARFALSLLRLAESEAIAKVQIEIERRDELSPSRIQRSLDSSATLREHQSKAEDARWARSKLPPAIDHSILELILDSSTPAKILSHALARDPYFQWLEHNSLGYSKVQNDNLKRMDPGVVRTDKKSLIKLPEQANPIELFIQYRNEEMKPELALIRLIRNMDPVLSPKGFRAANRAIIHSQLISALVEKVIPYVAARESSEERDAWLLVPSLKEGQENMRKLLDNQVARFGNYFPFKVFQNAAYLAGSESHAMDPVMDVINSYRLRRMKGVNEAQTLQELEPRLNLLRSRLGLPVEFPQARLYDIVDKIISLQAAASYESILADIFDPASGAKIRELRMILEIADAFARTTAGTVDGRRLNIYLEGKVLNEQGAP